MIKNGINIGKRNGVNGGESLNYIIILLQKNIDKVYGIWIPKCERDIISAITIESSKSKDRVIDGELINIMLSGETGIRMLNNTDEEILSEVLKELDKYIPEVSNNIKFNKVDRNIIFKLSVLLCGALNDYLYCYLYLSYLCERKRPKS